MDITAWILGIILAGVFGIAGLTKLLDFDRVREHLGYSRRQYRLIGLSEVAGAAGVISGLVWARVEWIGLAAGAGFCTLMVGAMIAHARVEDEAKKVIPAIVMLGLVVAYLIVIALR